jgi:hypothetical protein
VPVASLVVLAIGGLMYLTIARTPTTAKTRAPATRQPGWEGLPVSAVYTTHIVLAPWQRRHGRGDVLPQAHQFALGRIHSTPRNPDVHGDDLFLAGAALRSAS